MKADIINVAVTVGWVPRSYTWPVGDAQDVLGDLGDLDRVICMIAKSLFLAARGQIHLDGQMTRLEKLPEPRVKVMVTVNGVYREELVYTTQIDGKPCTVKTQLSRLMARTLDCWHAASGDLDADAAAMPDPHDAVDPIGVGGEHLPGPEGSNQ